MKKLYSLLLLVLLALTTRPVAAQTVFAPAGAEWWFDEAGGWPPPAPIVDRARVLGDTVLGGHVARRILVEQLMDTGTGFFVTVFLENIFVRTAADSVFQWDAAGASYRLMYNFGRSVGDQWVGPHCNGQLLVPMMLDSVDQLSVSGQSLRRQFQHPLVAPGSTDESTFREFAQPVIERFGSMGGLIFPQARCHTDWPDHLLRAYRDNIVSFGTVPPLLGYHEAAATAALTVAPNPSVSGRFQLNGLAARATSYRVFDALGRCVQHGQLRATQTEVNLTDQPAGLYLLRGEVAGQAFTRRLVRE